MSPHYPDTLDYETGVRVVDGRECLITAKTLAAAS